MEERRNKVELRNVVYKQRNSRCYNQKVQKWSSEARSQVLRRIFIATRNVGSGSLGLNWNGPYKVTKILPNVAHKLEDMAGRPLSHPWNAEHLRQYYQYKKKKKKKAYYVSP